MNTPNQGFPLAQYTDPPTAIGTTMFPALAAAADTKAAQLDADAARVQSPNMVKISCSLGYISANDPAGNGAAFDTVEFNRGTPTDLTIVNGLLLNRGLWMVGFEATLSPVTGFGNGQDIFNFLRLSVSASDPLFGYGYIRIDLVTTSETVGMSSILSTWGIPKQYQNACTVALAPTDNFTVAPSTGLFSGHADCPYMTLWAVQLGDL